MTQEKNPSIQVLETEQPKSGDLMVSQTSDTEEQPRPVLDAITNKSPILLNVGATWEVTQIEKIAEMNASHNNTKVTEVYGSMGEHPSARSFDRVPDWNLEHLVSYITAAHKAGIDIKWTLNQSCIGKIDAYSWDNYRHLVSVLAGNGVHKYIVTVPLLVELIHKEDPDAWIEISTINRISSLQEIDELVPLGINAICWDVMANRNFPLLRAGIELADRRGIKIEAIVNEFCTFMCVHRNTCYNLSSHNSGRTRFGGYPFSRCIKVREDEPWKWLSARFILPSWLQYYNSLGVSQFKITGRTHTTGEVLRVLRYYMSEADPENLLSLWHHVNVLVGDDSLPSSEHMIPTEYLRKVQFLRRFMQSGGECHLKECGRDCSYCPGVYLKAMEYQARKGA